MRRMNLAQSSPPPRTPRAFLQSLTRIGRLACKELAEILCDRRTILTLVLMPLLLYTLLSFAFRQFLMAFMTSPIPVKELRIGVDTAEHKRIVEAYLAFGAPMPWWRTAGLLGLEGSPLAATPLLTASYCLSGSIPHEPRVFWPYNDPPPGGRLPLVVEVVKNPKKTLSYGEIDAALMVTNNLQEFRLTLADAPALPQSAATMVGLAASLPGLGSIAAASAFITQPVPPNMAILSASTWGLAGSAHGAGPVLAATALFPGRTVRPHPLTILIEGKRPLILEWDLRFLQFEPRSREVVAIVEQHCTLANARQVQSLLAKNGLRVPGVPVRVIRRGVQTGEPAVGLSLSALVPLILILMTIT